MPDAAVIGAGYIAREHLGGLRNVPTAKVVAVCDLSPSLAEATAEEFRIPSWYTDHRQMLENERPDVVHITTPARSHIPLALDALEAGAHVFVEKPITFDSEALGNLAERARTRGLTVIEDHNYLFNRSVQRILGLIESGEFGDVVHVEVSFCSDVVAPGSPHADPNTESPYASLPGDIVSDFVTHLAYLCHAFVGEHREVSTVWAKRCDVESVRWDEFRALVRADRGTGALTFSAHSQPDLFWLRVHGTKMRASASLFEPLLTIEKKWGGPQPLTPVFNGLSLANAYLSSSIGGLWRKLRGEPVTFDGLWELTKRFYRSLEGEEDPPISMDTIETVHRLVRDLVAQEESP